MSAGIGFAIFMGGLLTVVFLGVIVGPRMEVRTKIRERAYHKGKHHEPLTVYEKRSERKLAEKAWKRGARDAVEQARLQRQYELRALAARNQVAEGQFDGALSVIDDKREEA
ncbi:MAG: hypothetical protein IT477_10885 [Rhodanobacteraceae bacterium]|nr:hypothetical protein [Rhodanobacteraceae bacterium]